MEYLFEFMIITAITCIGELLHTLIPLPIPAGIYGLIILFTCLTTGLIKLEKVKKAADFLLAIMPAMFVAPSVGLIDIIGGREKTFIYMALISMITTVIVIAVTGRTSQFVIRLGRQRQHE